jgi:uncharacterized Zn ribbon protein
LAPAKAGAGRKRNLKNGKNKPPGGEAKELKMENKFLKIEDWMETSEGGDWLIDELILDPHYDNSGCIVKDRETFYFLAYRQISENVKNEVKPLPYYKASKVSAKTKFNNDDYFLRGLEPRSGFKPVETGRAITPDEFSEIENRLQLTEDDISEEFEDTKGHMLGPKNQVNVIVKQIKVDGKAIGLERELQNKGIEAFSGSPGRLNIRVK